MSDNLRVGISANDVQILKDGEPVAGFTAGLALYVGSHVLKHVHADNPQAVEEIERALRLQDKDGRLAEACAQRKFDVQLLADGDVCCWLDDRIVFTTAADDAKQLAGEIITAATEIMRAENNY